MRHPVGLVVNVAVADEDIHGVDASETLLCKDGRRSHLGKSIAGTRSNPASKNSPRPATGLSDTIKKAFVIPLSEPQIAGSVSCKRLEQ